MFRRILELTVLASALAIATPMPTEAAVGDPVITITKSTTTVPVGSPIRFTVTVTGGAQVPRAVIRYTNPLTHSTINVAQLGTGFKFTYIPPASDAGRILTFVATIFVPASGHLVRPITATTTFKVAVTDTTSPAVSLSSPAAGSVVSGTVTLSATATDAVGVVTVKWFVDNVQRASDSDGAPWTRRWDSLSVPNGTHKVFAKARDAAGNWGTSRVISVTVSNP